MVDLKGSPFYLSDEDIQWVNDTFSNMTLEKKAGQVFCPMGFAGDEESLRHSIKDIGVGGMMYRPGFAKEIQDTHRLIQNLAEIPLLLAANTESGGNGLSFEGTSFGKSMAVAATGNKEAAYHMGYVACKEGAALGLNWSFAPIVDIDMEFRSPITNVRTFGSDPDKVIECASEYMRAADELGVAVSIKHFPGDGTDERDQHIVTSINRLNCAEWDATYGKVYQTLINKGAKTVMVGHIAQPAYVKEINPEATVEQQVLPASISKEIITGLLREKLGFNGLISTDATPMVGYTARVPRSKAIPMSIEAGADMILFNKSLDEDVGYIMAGLESGLLSQERLDDAVLRILATKASLKLHAKKAAGTLVPGEEALADVGASEHRVWAGKVADECVTLVKDTQNLLPISPEKYKRAYINVIQKSNDVNDRQVQEWKSLFEREGFEVTVRDRRTTFEVADFANISNLSPEKLAFMNEMYRGVEEMRKAYDLYVYIINMENQSNNTTMRINWNVSFGLGDDAPWFAAEIPVLMISTQCPYHLFDAPMVKTYINTYSSEMVIKEATMDKIMGRSPFKGISPVDPFCGRIDTRV